jgi:hypothetical protein
LEEYEEHLLLCRLGVSVAIGSVCGIHSREHWEKDLLDYPDDVTNILNGSDYEA